MNKVKKSFILTVLTCMTLVLAIFGTIFSLPSFTKADVSAKAETIEYQDLLGIENRDWGAHDGEYYFGGVTLTPLSYFNTADSVSGCWYVGNNSIIAANNGVDIMQYIYVNGKSARELNTENASGDRLSNSCNCWLSNPAACPVYVETTNGSGIIIRILKSYVGENYTITFKAGFSLIRNDGNVIYVSDDIMYNCVGNVPTKVQKSTVTFNDENGDVYTTKRVINGTAVGELPEVPEKAGYVGFWAIDGLKVDENTIITSDKTATLVYALEYEDLLGLEDRTSWGAHAGEYYFGGVTLEPFGYFNTADSVSGCWYVGNNGIISANYGVDIMEYIYVNGESARSLITKNASGDRLSNSCGCWLSNPAACPVYVETTNGSAIMIRLLKSYFGDKVTFTFKEGFSLIRNDGQVIYVSNDITYTYENGAFTARTVEKSYTLSFAGTDTTKKLKTNAVIGELPNVPEKSGYEGVWTIDGVEIGADSVYGYAENKTAVATYKKNITTTIGLGDWGVPETESDIRYLWIRNEGADIATAYSNSYWNDHADNKDSNYGVDIMEYILIDGESARSLVNKNASGATSYKASSTFPLNIGGIYAPVCIETAGDGIRFKVMVDFKTSFLVTFKAGFTLVNKEGVVLYAAEDVVYRVGAQMNDIQKIEGCVLSFAGVEDKLVVEQGKEIGALPEVPAKAGYYPVGWAIDGVLISADTIYAYDVSMTAQPVYLKQYVLSFAGIAETVTVTEEMEIGALPNVPSKTDCNGVWMIDGVEITETTVYDYGTDKTAVASYSKDITRSFDLEDRTSWGACAAGGEFYFGVLDKREANKVVNGESETYYLNSSVTGCWHAYETELIAANNGVDIMQYIYVNDKSARDLITENVNGSGIGASCICWLSNPAAYPVYVETTGGSGIMVKVAQAFSGNYFEITFKSGFSLMNLDGVRVYLSEDVTYKYIVSDEGATLAKGELTDADLDQLNGQTITLMNGNETYLTKKTCRLTLPEIAPVIVDNGLSQVFVGWTTDVNTLAVLYPAGYRLEPAAATTLYAVWVGFEMQDGAAVRLVANSSGLRFLTDIDANAYNAGFNGRLISVGTFLVPTDYLETGVDFVHSSFAEGYYLDKETATWRVQTGNTWTYAAAFVNISESQFARSFSARGYLKIEFTDGVGYVYTPYSAENNARSIYEVALEAYNDARYPEYKTNETILHYINSVANLTWDEADYTFAKTTGVAGNYEITDISLEGNTVTVSLEGNVSSAVINGKRLTSGSSSNVKMGDFLFNVSGFEKVAEGFRFTFGAAATTYVKESDETLYFNSSDEDLNFFLNDYFKRHSGYTEDGVDLKVNSVTAGVNAEEFFNHEWMSMSYYWYNSFDGYTDANGYNQDRIEGLRRVLSSVPVDDYGYVWSSNDRVRDAKSEIDSGEQKMGWPFPNNKTVGTMHWEFNGKDSKSWSDNIGGSIKNGLRTANISNRTDDIIFQSNTWKSTTGSKIYTYYAPLLEFELRIDNADSIQDIYVGYTTSEQSTLQWVSVKDYAFIAYPYSGAYNHIVYMPMYAFSGWGASTSTYITQIQIKIDVKDGQSMSGNVGLNYVRPTFDTRISNNNSILISSLRTDYDYTGDLTYLADNITRARKAMNFLMQMYDSARGLKRESYIVGHDAKKESLNWLGQAKDISIAGSISQGYWDIMFMPEYDFQSNMYFYKAVRDMAYLEGILEANNITVDKSLAAIKTADRAYNKSVSAYNSNNLESVANTVLTNLRQTTENTNHTGFWDATDGRFVAGYSSYEGKWYDYGYVTWNLEAIYYGIATESQAAAIMNWLSSESDLYDYVFAPRSNTVEGTDMLNGEYAAMKGDWDFGDNCQYGGAIMYSSFYDLMARLDTLGADNAFARLTAIQDWYKEVYDYYVANGTDPYDFYRYYYDNKGIQCQGLGTAGALGLDREFLESFLPISAVAYGFFGIDSVDGKTLEIAPKMPGSLDYWQMENLAFNKVKYDLKITKNGIQITDVRDVKAGLQIRVVLDIAQGQNVYVNGVKATDYEMVGSNQVAVTVDFATVVVEVK